MAEPAATEAKRNQYRASASLILAAKHAHNADTEPYDYSLLLVKRTERTAYALDHCVFPGGVFDVEADESDDWLAYLSDCGVTQAQLQLLDSHQTKERPPLMTAGRKFTRDISLRLTALRETFEEVGLLLCRPLHTPISELATAHVYLEPFERLLWQQRVHQDGKQFLQLCRQLQVLPDLWALSEWSVWRSPATASRKYDTVYYLAALSSNEVPLLLEPSEILSAHWLHPKDCWQHSRQRSIWLPFMLLYETARLLGAYRWQQLLDFARLRSSQGSALLQPIFYQCDDCMFGVLPGDELYLAEPDNYSQSIRLPGSMDEWMARARRTHRFMLYNFHEVGLSCNVEPIDGQLPPQTFHDELAKL